MSPAGTLNRSEHKGRNSPWWRCQALHAVVALTCLLLPALTSAELPSVLDAESVTRQVVTVRVYEDDRLKAEGSGVVVSGAGDVLTSAAVLDAGSRATVSAPGLGELAATIQWKESESGLGVLGVDGLQSAGLPLSAATLAPGDRIFSVTRASADEEEAFIPGAAGESVVRSIRGGDVRLLQHNAITTVHGYGSAVIDECGRLVALNVPDPEAFTWFTARHKVEPSGVMFALSVGNIASRLGSLGIEFAPATEPCLSATARAVEQARRDQEEIQQAQIDAQQAQEAEQEARQETQQAQAETERAREQARQAQAEAQRSAEQSAEARTREAEQRRQSERLRRLALWGGSAGGVLLLALLLSWAVSARQKRRAMRWAEARAADAEREAGAVQRRMDEMPRPAPFDCVLTAVDKVGTSFAVNLRREVLGDPEGVTVGRNPAGSSHVVADPSVSREHARFYVDGGELFVEDLGSTNGTALNEHALNPGASTRVSGGDDLTLGSVTFRVDLRP